MTGDAPKTESPEDAPDEPAFNYSAPLPLPPDWRPPGHDHVDVAPRAAPSPGPVETIEDLGIGPQTPYPTKEQ